MSTKLQYYNAARVHGAAEPIWSVGGLSATFSLLSTVPSIKTYYLDGYLTTCTLYFKNIMTGAK
jgi:hypothetical protein